MKPTYVSYSQINRWQMCPKSYEYQYIKHLPIVQGGRMIAGSAYHRGVAYALGSKANGFDVTEEEVKEIVYGAWEAAISDKLVKGEGGEVVVERKSIDWKDDNPEELKQKASAFAIKYCSEMLPNLDPMLVEKRCSRILPSGLLLVGYPDLELKSGEIADHKFVTKRASQNDIDKGMQGTTYAILKGRPLIYSLHQALDQKKPDFDTISTKRSEADINWGIDVIEKTWLLIQTGIFPPNSSSWLCSPDYCSFWHECRIFMEV